MLFFSHSTQITYPIPCHVMYDMGTLEKPKDMGTMFNVLLKIYSNMSGILGKPQYK